MRALALVAVLALAGLTGCGTVRALAGPDPALVAVAPTIQQALVNDSAAHPENKPKNDAAGQALESNVNPPTVDAPSVFSEVGALFTTVPGLAAVGGVLTAIGVLLDSRKRSRAVGVAVAQHAELIDSVTPESADFAKKV